MGTVVDALDGGLDALVSNAGFGIVGPLEEVSDAEFRDQLEVNLVGTMALCRACLPALRRAGGVIVQISSVGGQVGSSGLGAYNASKFGLEGASEALAEEVGSQGVRVVLVEPGAFRTSIAAKSPAIRGRGGSGQYEALWQELDDFLGYLDADAEDATIAIDAIVAAATVPGAPFRLPVGSGIGSSIREKVAKVLADVDAAEAFLASNRDYVRGDGPAPDPGLAREPVLSGSRPTMASASARPPRGQYDDHDQCLCGVREDLEKGDPRVVAVVVGPVLGHVPSDFTGPMTCSMKRSPGSASRGWPKSITK